MREPIRKIKVADLVMLAIAVAVVAAMWGGGSINAASTTAGQLLIIGGDTGGNLTYPPLDGITARVPSGVFDNSTNAVQVYDPTIPGFVPGDFTTYPIKVEGAWAVALPDGRVLVTGGANCGGAGTLTFLCAALNTAKIYNPNNNGFTAAGAMNHPRAAALATLIAGSGTN
ncbi:MAG TPA: kelch repeat-containing protein [Candidatus Binataceae bacterium]|nr:kelch repeat-containing protein [Candidatus Binataceae bacterium]